MFINKYKMPQTIDRKIDKIRHTTVRLKQRFSKVARRNLDELVEITHKIKSMVFFNKITTVHF